jgi:hypothetical protein
VADVSACAHKPEVVDRQWATGDEDQNPAWRYLAYDPTGEAKAQGEGKTADWAEADYYARNNTTEKYPKRDKEGQYH